MEESKLDIPRESKRDYGRLLNQIEETSEPSLFIQLRQSEGYLSFCPIHDASAHTGSESETSTSSKYGA